MYTVPQAMALALNCYRAGDLAQAGTLGRQVTEMDPGNADAWCFCGMVARAQGKAAEAVEWYRQALRLRPNFAEAHNNLGNALLMLGRHAEAVASYQEALRLNPHYADARNNLAEAVQAAGQRPDPVASAPEPGRFPVPPIPPSIPVAGVASDVDRAEAENKAGIACLQKNQWDEAAAHFREAIRLNPQDPQPHNNLGIANYARDRLDEAVASYGEALRLKPAYLQAHNNLGITLLEHRKPDEAVASFRATLRLDPQHAEASYNLGLALDQLGQLDEAADSYRQALRIQPGYLKALSGLASVLRAQGKKGEALTRYRQIQEAAPASPTAHFNRAFACLLLGDYERGWPEYEWRQRALKFAWPTFSQPVWDGAPLQGRTILLNAEQGLGDTLQFIRYAPRVKERGGQVCVVCQPQLEKLLARSPGIDRLLPRGAPLPAFDCHANLMSLPAIFHTTVTTVPAEVPYVFADPAQVEDWRREMSVYARFKVGIVWQGNPEHRADRLRSVPLTELAPLARRPGVQLFSLQMGPGTAQLGQLAGAFKVTDLGSRLGVTTDPRMSTAALMKNLDLVLSVDTMAAHLAGALGVRVWLLLAAAADFRWLLDRSDSPWYPTMRLFRQKRAGDWSEIIRQVTEALQQAVTHV